MHFSATVVSKLSTFFTIDITNYIKNYLCEVPFNVTVERRDKGVITTQLSDITIIKSVSSLMEQTVYSALIQVGYNEPVS